MYTDSCRFQIQTQQYTRMSGKIPSEHNEHYFLDCCSLHLLDMHVNWIAPFYFSWSSVYSELHGSIDVKERPNRVDLMFQLSKHNANSAKWRQKYINIPNCDFECGCWAWAQDDVAEERRDVIATKRNCHNYLINGHERHISRVETNQTSQPVIHLYWSHVFVMSSCVTVDGNVKDGFITMLFLPFS